MARFQRFEASLFIETKLSTVEDKAWFADHLLAFIQADFPKAKLTEKLYQRLSNTFGFIAYYDRAGFWSTFFEDTAGKIKFLRQIVRHPCYGDATCTFSDVEMAVKQVLIQDRMLERYEIEKLVEDEEAERELLARLQAKYAGVPDKPGISPLVEAQPPLSIALDLSRAHATGEELPMRQSNDPSPAEIPLEDDCNANQIEMF